MRVVKNILISLGALILVVLALFTWVGVGSGQFRKEEAPFVEKFVSDLSKRWDTADVSDRMMSALIIQTGTPQGLKLLQEFSQLGALKSVQDLELRSYRSFRNYKVFSGEPKSEQTGLFSFKGTFENGEGVVNVSIVKKDGAVHVIGFFLKATHLSGVPKLET